KTNESRKGSTAFGPKPRFPKPRDEKDDKHWEAQLDFLQKLKTRSVPSPTFDWEKIAAMSSEAGGSSAVPMHIDGDSKDEKKQKAREPFDYLREVTITSVIEYGISLGQLYEMLARETLMRFQVTWKDGKKFPLHKDMTDLREKYQDMFVRMRQ